MKDQCLKKCAANREYRDGNPTCEKNCENIDVDKEEECDKRKAKCEFVLCQLSIEVIN